MKDLEKEIEYWLEKNQFKDGPFKGQFGTNTMHEDRKLYHHPEGEDIYVTPQMFMTYLGTLCMLNHKEKYATNIDYVLSFLDGVFKNGDVLFLHNPLTEQNVDSFHEESFHEGKKYLISYRHTAIGLSNYLVLRKNIKFVEEKINKLIEGHIQNEDGGWPLSNEGQYMNSDLTTSIYFVHLFDLFSSLKINSKLNEAIKQIHYNTIVYLDKEFENQYKTNFERILRTIPSFYLLGFGSFLKYNNPLLYNIPKLIIKDLIDADGGVKVNNPKKIHRYTIRYCNCLFMFSLIDTSYYDTFVKIRSNVTNDLNFQELNTFEMFVLLNFIGDKRLIKDKVMKAIDFGLPLLNLIPEIGGVIYSYVEKFKDD